MLDRALAALSAGLPVACPCLQRCACHLPCRSLALAALFFAFVPWGFASFLNGDGSSGSTIGGAGGAPAGNGSACLLPLAAWSDVATHVASRPRQFIVLLGPAYLAAAKAVVVVCEVLAVMYAAAGLLVQLQALLRANDFLHRYRRVAGGWAWSV